MESMKDKVILVTGSSSGIGASAAIYLASLGARIALTGRNQENLDKVAGQCREKGLSEEKVHVVAGDVTCNDDVKRITESTVKHFGRLDVLVNNAGVLRTGTLADCNMDDYNLVMDSNVKSNIMVSKAALPHLVESKGNIICVSSFSGLRPMANCLFYAISKAATDQFVKILSVELAPQGVRVNGVNPGVIVTDLHRRSGYSDTKYEQYIEDQKSLVPLGRAGECDEVASAIAFLASDMATYISGVTMAIDGARANSTPRYVVKCD